MKEKKSQDSLRFEPVTSRLEGRHFNLYDATADSLSKHLKENLK